MEKSIIRELLSDKQFQKIHGKWAIENNKILNEDKDKWNFGIIVRNHTRDAFDLMIERAIELELDSLPKKPTVICSHNFTDFTKEEILT